MIFGGNSVISKNISKFDFWIDYRSDLRTEG
jgi:hypothetical protein